MFNAYRDNPNDPEAAYNQLKEEVNNPYYDTRNYNQSQAVTVPDAQEQGFDETENE